jgi:hypothetical protein
MIGGQILCPIFGRVLYGFFFMFVDKKWGAWIYLWLGTFGIPFTIFITWTHNGQIFSIARFILETVLREKSYFGICIRCCWDNLCKICLLITEQYFTWNSSAINEIQQKKGSNKASYKNVTRNISSGEVTSLRTETWLNRLPLPVCLGDMSVFHDVQTGCRTHPASYSMSTGADFKD